MKADDRKVIIRGQVFRYDDKSPFQPSGRSIQGAIEYDPRENQIRCHECGKWFSAVGSHLRSHRIDPNAYKATHGLNKGTSLCSPSLSSVHRDISIRMGTGKHLSPKPFAKGHRASWIKGKPQWELRNLRNRCVLQLKSKILKIAAELSRAPTQKVLSSNGISANSVAAKMGIPTSQLMQSLGLEPNRGGFTRNSDATEKYTKVVLIELLMDFWALNKRLPVNREHRSGSLPTRHTYRRYFGSMRDAYEAAGLLKVSQ